MKFNGQQAIKLVCLMVLYLLLGYGGLYYSLGLIAFPILALPLVLYFMRNKAGVNVHIIFHGITTIAILLTTGSWLMLIGYLVGVCIPTYVILYFYKREIPFPNAIMYITLCLAVVAFIFVAMMKGIGIDFQGEFVKILNAMKEISVESIEQWMIQQGTVAGVSKSEIFNMSVNIKQLLSELSESLKMTYGALVVIQVLLSTSFSLIIMNSIIRRKEKTESMNIQLLDFRLSKVAVLILFISLLMLDLSGNNPAVTVLGMNLMFFLVVLFQLAGVLALFGIIRKTSVSKSLKVVGYVLVIVVFSTVPYLVMFFGCLDAIFNYRKVNIVV